MAHRIQIVLACEECGARNYQTTKARRHSQPGAPPEGGATGRLVLKKYCSNCSRHTEHKESK